jgi:carbonic anhydrase
MSVLSQLSLLTFNNRIQDSVREDIATLRKSPFIKQGTQLVGLTYNVETGEVAMVE